jgi:hypothetical protein
MPVWQAAAARRTESASVAPEPSPRRMPKLNSAALPIRSRRRWWPGSAETWPTTQWSSARVDREKHRGGDGRGIAIEHDRHAAHPRGEHGAGDRGDLKPAEAAQQLERIGLSVGVAGDGGGDDFALVGERRAGDAGAGADPIRRPAAEERLGQRGCRGRVGDPHLAERQGVDARLDRHHPIGDRVGAFRLGHRRGLDDIGGRLVEVHLVDAEIGVDRLAELVHRGAAGDEVLHHLRRHRGRIGRDAAGGDPVIAGEDGGARVVDPRRMAALPGREPLRQLLEPAEGAAGLRQLRLAQRGGGAGLEIGAGQMSHQRADFVEARRRFGHGFPWCVVALGVATKPVMVR